MSYKSELFNEVLEKFEVEEMKLFCIDLLEKRPEINYFMSSSTTNKHHNPTQCQAGGQILHEIMVASVMNYLLGLEYIKEKYPQPKKRDALRIAAIMHDCCKTGKGKFTVHDHPILGGKFVEECNVEHDINIKLKQYINRLIQSHSGEWVTSKKSKFVLPKPENGEQFLVHLCDYLSSRADIDMIFPENLLESVKKVAVPAPEDFFFSFGKYKNMSFSEVEKTDKSYLVWLRDQNKMPITEPLKTLLEQIGDDI